MASLVGASSPPGAAGQMEAGAPEAEDGGVHSGEALQEPAFDAFGIRYLYPSAVAGGLWTSEHWGAGASYEIDSRQDAKDPQGISGMRGSSRLAVSSEGELVMGGSQPRIYIYSPPEGAWRDVEITAYYQRVSDDATAWGAWSLAPGAARRATENPPVTPTPTIAVSVMMVLPTLRKS